MGVGHAVARNFVRYLEENWAVKHSDISKDGNEAVVTLKNGVRFRFHVVFEEEK